MIKDSYKTTMEEVLSSKDTACFHQDDRTSNSSNS